MLDNTGMHALSTSHHTKIELSAATIIISEVDEIGVLNYMYTAKSVWVG